MIGPTTIAWHEENQKNWKKGLDKCEEAARDKLKKIELDRKRLDFYTAQINEAKRACTEEEVKLSIEILNNTRLCRSMEIQIERRG